MRGHGDVSLQALSLLRVLRVSRVFESFVPRMELSKLPKLSKLTKMTFLIFVIVLFVINAVHSLDNGLARTPPMGWVRKLFLSPYPSSLFLFRISLFDDSNRFRNSILTHPSLCIYS